MCPMADEIIDGKGELIRHHFGEEIYTRILKQGLAGEKDFVSEVFEEVMTHAERKAHGQFFTHSELVEYIISRLPIQSDSTIIDPACGAGAFLAAASRVTNGHARLIGVDINQDALDFCRLSLDSLSECTDFTLLCSDSINQLSPSDLVDLSGGDLDIAIGNPPFMNLKRGVDYDPMDSIYRHVVNGVTNSCTLIIAKTLSLLREGGWMGFVLPKNILRVNSFSSLRRHLAQNTRIIEIFDLGHYFKDVRGDQVILILQKGHLNQEELDSHHVTIKVLMRGESFDRPHTYSIPQSTLLEFDHYPIFLNHDILPLAKKMLTAESILSDHADIFRGLSYGSKNALVDDVKHRGWHPLYRGKSIRPFGIAHRLWLDPAFTESTPNSKIARLAHAKVAVQNICSREGGIRASTIGSDELTLDTVTNVVPKDEEHLRFITALLNSRLSNFFTILILFLHSNFTMHTDRMYIGRIPFVEPTASHFDEVNRLVSEIEKTAPNSAEYSVLYECIQRTIYDVYQVAQQDVQTIEKSLKLVMSVKSYG